MSSPTRGAEPFWLCHECGAQMRPIRTRGIPQCASCEGEFIEILDPSVNPDPFHELPPAPPVRPTSTSPTRSNPSRTTSRPTSPHANDGGGFMQSLFSNIFGGDGQGSGNQSAHPHADQSDQSARARNDGFGGGSGRGGSQGSSGLRTFQFNFPGGGAGSFTIGTFGGGTGGMGGMAGGTMGNNPFGDSGGALDSFFPGFPPPSNRPPRTQGQPNPFARPGQFGNTANPMDGGDLLSALMAVIQEEMGPNGPNMMMFGPGAQGNAGDYVMTQQGFDDVLERLMQAAGPQGPLPASDVVIEGLPRFKLDEKKLDESPFKDCPVCKDDFVVDDEVMRIPCTHIFHVDCIQPWLKVNGSCPVCRFSLVPDQSNEPPRAPASQPSASANPAPSPASAASAVGTTVTNILQRLWGQSGSASSSNPTSPTEERPPPSMGQSVESSNTPSAPPSASSVPGSFPSLGLPQPDGPSQPSGTENASSMFLSATSQPPGVVSPTSQSAHSPETTGNAQPPTSSASRQAHSDRDPQRSLDTQSSPVDQVQPSRAIPDDYRERHRQKERENEERLLEEDLD